MVLNVERKTEPATPEILSAQQIPDVFRFCWHKRAGCDKVLPCEKGSVWFFSYRDNYCFLPWGADRSAKQENYFDPLAQIYALSQDLSFHGT